MQNLIIKKVIAAIIMRDDKVLIAQRAKKDVLYGKWEFPGGKMEVGETEHECLKRELFEEFGIHAHVGDYVVSSFFEHKGNPMEMRVYEVRDVTGDFHLYDHQQIKWVKADELPGYDMPEPDAPIVDHLLRKKPE